MFNDALPDYLYDTHPGYLVGGALRDLFCSRAPVDWDIAVFEDPYKRASRLAQLTGGRFFKLGANRFAHFRVVHATGCVDITPIHNGNIEADLARRDFTINAMAYDLSTNKLIDPLNGRDDIDHQLVRMTGPDCFINDPARLIRAHRMAANFRFHIDPLTFRTMTDQATLISGVPGERIWPEWQIILQASQSSGHVRAMAENGLLAALFPDADWDIDPHKLSRLNTLAGLEEIFENPEKQKHLPGPAVNFINTMRVKERTLSKTAVLMHGMDTKKLNHCCNRLRTSRGEAEWIDFVVKNRRLATSICQSASMQAIGRFFNLSSTYAPHLLLHGLAAMLITKNELNKKYDYILGNYNKLLMYYFEKIEPLCHLPPLVTGRELMNATGLNPSPRLGELLTTIKEAHLEGRIQTKIEALNLAKSLSR